MENHNGVFGLGLFTKYSILETDNTNCLNILKETDTLKRHKLIDELISKLSTDNEKSGFFSNNDVVEINLFFSLGFKINDNEIYYTFFDNLEKLLNKNNKFNGATVKAIIKTECDYFGKVATPDTMSIRNEISQCYLDENDNLYAPSIKEYKNKNCGACVEYASVAHNLFLLAGFKSFYVSSKDVKFQNSNTGDGHAFVIVENQNNKALLFDIVNNIVKPLDKNPIEDMFNNKPFIVNNDCYANASYMNHEKPLG